MAYTQLLCDGTEKESRASQKYRRESENRQNVVSLPPHPHPEMILVTGNLEGKGLLSITAGGKSHFYSLTRKDIFKLNKQISEAIDKMEPSEPANWNFYR